MQQPNLRAGVRRGAILAVVMVGTALPPGLSARLQAATAPAASPAGTQHFGINTHLLGFAPGDAGLRHTLAYIRAAGLTVVRFDLNWHGLEPESQGKWDPETLARLDYALDEIRKHELIANITFLTTPPWARRGAAKLYPGLPAWQPDGDKMTPPNNPEDFGRVLGALAARYADKTKWPPIAWEIWNEPNLAQPFWFIGGGRNDPVCYTRLLRAAYPCIKAADPTAIVLTGGLASLDHPFLAAMYQAGAHGSFDALAIHPYTNNRGGPDWIPHREFERWESIPVNVWGFRSLLVSHGDGDKPIWVTETGWDIKDDAKRNPANPLDYDRPAISDASRAGYFRELVRLVRSWPFVACVSPYQFQTGDFPGMGLHNWRVYANGVYSFPETDHQGRPIHTWSAYTDEIQHGTRPDTHWPQRTATVELRPTDTAARPRGSTFTAEVLLQTGGCDVAALDVQLNYPADLLAVVGVSTTRSCIPAKCWRTARGDDATGLLTLSAHLEPGDLQPSAEARTLATVTFRAVAPGNALPVFLDTSSLRRYPDRLDVLGDRLAPVLHLGP